MKNYKQKNELKYKQGNTKQNYDLKVYVNITLSHVKKTVPHEFINVYSNALTHKQAQINTCK